MSKKLDDEYKKFVTQEVPDLWERIEAGLPEKNVETATISEMEKVTPIWNKRNFKMFITAAACVCVLIISGGVFRLAGSSSMSEMAEYSSVADEAMQEEAMNAATMDEAVMGEAAEAEEAPAEEAAETEEMPTEDAATETNGTADRTNSVTEDKAGGMQAVEEEVDGNARESTDAVDMDMESASKEQMAENSIGMFYDVVVTVESIESTGEEVLYHGIIVSADVRPVEVEGKVLFCISDNEFPEFEVGKTYSLQLEDVEPQSSAVHPYVVTEVYE